MLNAGINLPVVKKQIVKHLIVEMKRANRPLSRKAMCDANTERRNAFLTKLAGQHLTKKRLHELACYHYGSWNKALNACNIPKRKKFTFTSSFWKKPIIISCIQHLYKVGHPLNTKSIFWDQSYETSIVLSKVTGRWTTGAGLYNAGQRLFGSWNKALAASKIDIEEIKESPFWSKRKIIKVIRALHREKIPLNSQSMQFDTSNETIQIIKRETGKVRTGKSLIGAAYRMFGSWDKALRKSGVNPKDFRIRRFKWTKLSIRKVIRILHNSNIPLNGGHLGLDRDARTKVLIQQTVGRGVQGKRIYQLGKLHLGSWDGALKHAGFSPAVIRKKAASCIANHEQLVEFIQTLYLEGYALNPSSLHRETRKIRLFLEMRFGQSTGGYSLINTSKKLFGSWDRALWEAGLSPMEIRKRSRSNTTHLPIVLYQVEDTKVDGERRRVKYLGAPPKSPEEILEEHSASEKLESAVNQLSASDQELTEKIFEAILHIHHYNSQEQLIQYVMRYLGGEVTEAKIALILNNLAQNIRRN